MAGLWRAFLMLAAASLISLVLVLMITDRGVDQDLVPVYWTKLVLTQDQTAQVVKEWYGVNPPRWAMRLAVVWQRANPAQWWWLPLLMIAAMFIISRFSRRKAGR
ncbi:hypothetical protein AAU61_19580 [Desulfocarbo indianensis]|nr:hypothetical protein AAU61_19580 [Desulfocarbo indianensis]